MCTCMQTHKNSFCVFIPLCLVVCNLCWWLCLILGLYWYKQFLLVVQLNCSVFNVLWQIYIYIYNFILTKLASKLCINSVTVDLKGRHLFLFLQLTFKKIKVPWKWVETELWKMSVLRIVECMWCKLNIIITFCFREFLKSLVLGQMVSLFLCGTAVFSELLQLKGVHTPTG